MTKPTAELRGLYLVTPESLDESAVSASLRGGARLIQYRDKSSDDTHRRRTAETLLRLCETHGALLLINDDVPLAQATGAHGVHLGQGDMPLALARATLGHDAIIGITCHDRLDLALAAESGGANYVAFGAVYPSPTKPHAVSAPLMLIAQARELLRIPICVIGGVTTRNASAAIAAGADMVAVSSGVFARPDPEAEARQLAALYESARDKIQETRDK